MIQTASPNDIVLPGHKTLWCLEVGLQVFPDSVAAHVAFTAEICPGKFLLSATSSITFLTTIRCQNPLSYS